MKTNANYIQRSFNHFEKCIIVCVVSMIRMRYPGMCLRNMQYEIITYRLRPYL